MMDVTMPTSTKPLSKDQSQSFSPADPRRRKDSVLYQKRVKTTTLPSLLPQINERAVQLAEKEFDNQSHQFQHSCSAIDQINQRIENRVAQKDEQTQLAVKTADEDAKAALNAARFFRDVALSSQNQIAGLQTQINQFQQQLDLNQRRTAKSQALLDAFSFEFAADRPALQAQLLKIKQTAAECQLLATELGFPVPQQPEALELITEQALEMDPIVIENKQRTLQQISLDLLLAEQQVLRSHNFLMKQLISDSQKEQTKTEQQTQQSSPADVFQREFGGSGVAVARELVNLRNKTAALLLREQAFDQNALLNREGADDGTLRALVVGLQNELHFAKIQLDEMQAIGLKPKPQQISENQLSGEQIAEMANMALQQADVDLLPEKLARSVDTLVLQATKDAEDVAEIQIKVKAAKAPVSQLQQLIERRNEQLQQMDRINIELLKFVAEKGDAADLEAELTAFFGNHLSKSIIHDQPEQPMEVEGSSSSGEDKPAYTAPTQKLFADKAAQHQQHMDERLDSMLAALQDYTKDVLEKLRQENVEKFQRDGSGFAEAMERTLAAVRHARELHRTVAQRNGAIKRLQMLVEQLCTEKAVEAQKVGQLVGARNGLLVAYGRLKCGYEQLQLQNQELRKSNGNQLQKAVDTAILNQDQKLAGALQVSTQDYTQSIKQLAALVKEEAVLQKQQLSDQLDVAAAALTGYCQLVRSREQVACQTDRARKTWDMAVQAATGEAAPVVGKKK